MACDDVNGTLATVVGKNSPQSPLKRSNNILVLRRNPI